MVSLILRYLEAARGKTCPYCKNLLPRHIHIGGYHAEVPKPIFTLDDIVGVICQHCRLFISMRVLKIRFDW